MSRRPPSSASLPEQRYLAAQFRGAYKFHLLYSSSLLLMFIAGAFLDADGFRVASLTLGPCFAGVIVIRVGLHHSADECWAQRFGTRVMCAVDASIWLVSVRIFHQRPIQAPVLIFAMYAVALVLYPIMLMLRTFSHTQISVILAVAVATTTASPVWAEGLTQLEFIATNVSALFIGTCFAYLLEGLMHETRQMHPREASGPNMIHSLMSEAASSLVGGLDSMRVLFAAADENRFAIAPTELVFGRPAQAALGIEHYMCVPRELVLQGLIDGTEAIIREVRAGGTDADIECLEYVLHAEAGSSDRTYQGGLKRDCDERGRVLACRTVTEVNGFTRGMRLEDFMSHPSVRHANLTESHVVALRLYTTQAFRSINNPLRDKKRFERDEPHPLAVTVALIRDALGKLRAVEADHSHDSALRRVALYRGMKDVTAPASFMMQGGTELAPISTTSDLSVAMRYSASVKSVLLRLITESFYDRGPNISFLSAFPGEAEFLFPPLTYLQPTGHVETVEVEGLAYEVVDVRPRI